MECFVDFDLGFHSTFRIGIDSVSCIDVRACIISLTALVTQFSLDLLSVGHFLRDKVVTQANNQFPTLYNHLTLTLPGPSAGVNGSLDSYCSLKPLCSGMGEVVSARTSPTLLPPSPRTVLSLSCFKVSQCINCRDWHCKRYSRMFFRIHVDYIYYSDPNILADKLTRGRVPDGSVVKASVAGT